MTIARFYDEDKNPPDADGRRAFIEGVGLRNLTEDEFNALPGWLQNQVDAWPAYRKTKPPSQATPAARQDNADKKEN